MPLGYQIASSKRAVSTCGQATRPPRDHVRADGRLGDGLLPAADYYKDDPAGERKPAKDRRKRNAVRFGVPDLHRSDVHVLFVFLETKSTIGQRDDAYDDEYDADKPRWFHASRVTKRRAGPRRG